MKDIAERPEPRRFTLERKAAGATIVSYPSVAETVSRVITGPVLPLRLRSLIPATAITGNGVLYARETSITSSVVVPVADGAKKPEAGLTYEIQLSPVVTIPAYLKVPDQYWEDFPMLQEWMDSRLRYALAQAEEKQLLNGSGVAPNLTGLMTVAITVATIAGAGGVALLDNVGAGIGSVYGYGYIADGIVLNPTDWGKMLNAKGTGGGYIGGAPAEIVSPLSLWGVNVVLSAAMASGSYLVGQFNPYSQIFDREQINVEVADQNEDDFVKDMITMRAEERLAFAVYQPGAFAKGTFTP